MTIGINNNKVIFSLDVSGGRNHPLKVFSSLDVKNDSLLL